MKTAVLHPKARDTIRGFPEDVRGQLGKLIFLLQRGESLEMPHARPMPRIAPGVGELRVKGKDGIYRAFYYTRVANTVIVIHAFMKKTQKTPPLELQLGKKRLKELLDG